MRHFPIEHRQHPPGAVVHHIARAIVAVDQCDARGGRGRRGAQPADRGADDRLRREGIGIDHLFPIIERDAPALIGGGRVEMRGERRGVGVMRSEPAERSEELLAQRPGMIAEPGAIERADHHAVVDPLHQEEWAAKLRAARLQRDRTRHRHDPRRALIGAKFGFALGIDQPRRRLATQDQPPPLAVDEGVEAIGFAARPAGDARQIADHHRRFPQPGEIGFDRRTDLAHAGSSAAWKPDGACGPTTSCSSTPRPRFTVPSGAVIVTPTSAWICR